MIHEKSLPIYDTSDIRLLQNADVKQECVAEGVFMVPANQHEEAGWVNSDCVPGMGEEGQHVGSDTVGTDQIGNIGKEFNVEDGDIQRRQPIGRDQVSIHGKEEETVANVKTVETTSFDGVDGVIAGEDLPEEIVAEDCPQISGNIEQGGPTCEIDSILLREDSSISLAKENSSQCNSSGNMEGSNKKFVIYI